MKDRKGQVHGDNDCKIVCKDGPPPTCPIYACSRRFQQFGEDMSKQERKNGKSKAVLPKKRLRK